MTLDLKMADIVEIFKSEMNRRVIKIQACGHHDLNRNLVYTVLCDDISAETPFLGNDLTPSNESVFNNQVNAGDYMTHALFVIKFYYKPLKQLRELRVLSYYKSCPIVLLATGNYRGIEWSIYPFIEGEALEAVYDTLSLENKIRLIESIGVEVGRFHALAQFEIFGDWISDKQSPLECYKAFIVDDTERIIHNIEGFDLQPSDVFSKAIQRIRSTYDSIAEPMCATLCHRDLDGRNIIVKESVTGNFEFVTFLDFEKTVMYNPSYDLINFYRKYFYKEPNLIGPFLNGYKRVSPLPNDFEGSFEFNLLRMGLDIISWSHLISRSFYEETVEYIQYLLENGVSNLRF